MGYDERRSWADRYISAIKSIVGPRLLVPAPMELDMKQATDLLVFCARDVRIACRIRRYSYVFEYGDEFTLRCQLDSGVQTEEEKILQGWGDWMFYGFTEEDPELQNFCRWFLIDLAAFREHLRRRPEIRTIVSRMSNGDGTHFHCYKIASFIGQPKLLIAQQELILRWF
jgi:hypothetical protein